MSIRQGCRAVSLARSTYRYRPKPKQDGAVIDALNALVTKHPAIGFWQSYHRLRLAGRPWNHKRVYRVYTALGLNIRRRADNSPEFISQRLDTWCKDRKITLAFIQPGKLTQNAYVERLNGSLRRELLNAYVFRVFRTLDEVRERANKWQYDYNHRRPHKSLGYQTPVNVLPLPESSTSSWAI